VSRDITESQSWRVKLVAKPTTKRYWRVRGHDGFKTIFETTVGLGHFSDDQIQRLLQALTAKAGLSFTEIVGAHAKRRTNIANELLAVHKDFAYPTYRCGSNPVFTASVVDENGKISRNPTNL
jgi:hypothetical protein